MLSGKRTGKKVGEDKTYNPVPWRKGMMGVHEFDFEDGGPRVSDFERQLQMKRVRECTM